MLRQKEAQFFLIIFCFFVFSQIALADPVIKIVANHFPPYAIENGVTIEKGNFQTCNYKNHTGFGIDVDILIEAFNIAGFNYSIRFVPFARLKRELDSGRADVTAGFFYAEDDGVPRYKYILYDIGGATHFYKKKGRVVKLNTIEDLADLEIGIVRGDSYGVLFDQAKVDGYIIKIQEATDNKQNFRKLIGGRFDVLPINDIVGEYILKKEQITSQVELLNFKLDYGTDSKQDGIHIAFSKHVDDYIVNEVKNSIKAMKKQRKIECVKSKYGITSHD